MYSGVQKTYMSALKFVLANKYKALETPEARAIFLEVGGGSTLVLGGIVE